MKLITDKEILLIKENENITFKFILQNTYDKNIYFENTKFVSVFYNKNRVEKMVPLDIVNLTSMKSNEKKIIDLTFISPYFEDKDDIIFRMTKQFYNLPEGFQGNKVNIKLQN